MPLSGTQGSIDTSVPRTVSAPPTEAELKHQRQVEIVTHEFEHRSVKFMPGEIEQIAETIVTESERAQLDPLLVLAVIEVESAYEPEAVSVTGCRGLMQVCPSTFRMVSDAKRMFDPLNNIRAGIAVLKRIRDAGFKRLETVLLAYNQGPGVALSVYRDGQEAPAEGQAYVPAVVAKYKALLAKNGFNPKDARKLFSTAPEPQPAPKKVQVAKREKKPAPQVASAQEPPKEVPVAAQEDHPVPPTVVAEAVPGSDLAPSGDVAESHP